MSTCAVGPCTQEREADSSFCAKHGPNKVKPSAKQTRDAQLVCPHCQTKGKVNTRRTSGFSTKKATAGAMTFGLSTIFGLGKKQQTVAKCSNCGQEWQIK